MTFSIIGTGHALPELTVTNDDLAKRVNTSNEWIVEKTGIRERRIISVETLTDISTKAGAAALENAGVKPEDIDLVIYSTLGGDTVSPSMACVVALRLGINCAAFDLNAACSGFIYALDVAAGYFARKKARKILLVCGEQVSRFTDWDDRATCVLFGDGAGAVVLGEGDSLLSIRTDCIPNDTFIKIPYAKNTCPYTSAAFEKPYLTMNGQEVYKFAVNAASGGLKSVLAESGLQKEDISYYILHQANQRITEAIAKQFGIGKEKFLSNIERTGNTSSATIPILLDEVNRKGLLKKNDILAFSAFGAGLTSGAAVLRWTK